MVIVWAAARDADRAPQSEGEVQHIVPIYLSLRRFLWRRSQPWGEGSLTMPILVRHGFNAYHWVAKNSHLLEVHDEVTIDNWWQGLT